MRDLGTFETKEEAIKAIKAVDPNGKVETFLMGDNTQITLRKYFTKEVVAYIYDIDPGYDWR